MSDEPISDQVLAAIRRVLNATSRGLVRLRPAIHGVVRATEAVLKFARRLIVRLLLVGLVSLPTVAVLVVLFSGEWTPDAHVAATALWVAWSIAIVGGIWAILWILVRLFLRFVRSSALGPSLGPRLMALLLVLALFPKTFTPTIEGVAWATVAFGLATPINMMRLSGNALEDPEPVGRADQAVPAVSRSFSRFDGVFVLYVVERFKNALDKTVSQVATGLVERVPLNTLAVVVALWFLLALLINEAIGVGLLSWGATALRVVAARTGELIRVVASNIGQYPSLNWSNIGFLLILTAGMFLSMAAITSLPRLRESSKPNSDVSAESLKRDLTELQLSEAQINNYYEKDIPGEIVVLDSVLPASDGTPGDESNKTVISSTAGASKPNDGRRTRSEPVEKATEPAGGEATKVGGNGTSDKRDAVPKDSAATDSGAKDSKAAETIGASALAAAKAKLAAATADLNRVSSEYVSFEEPNKLLEHNRNFASALSRESEAREEMDLANEDFGRVALVESRGNTLRGAWSDLVSRSRSLKDFVQSDESQSLSSAVREYSAQNIERHGSREEIAHFLRIRSWYAQKINSHQNALRQCGEQLRSARSPGAAWTSAMRRALTRSDSLSDAYQKTRDVFEQTNAVHRLLTSAECDIPDVAQIPGPPPLGDSLGPLRFMAGWLLNADSLPLALIVGLVGFGLLGSAISTFVRERLTASLVPAASPERHVIVSDLAGVALRGISAAIVVFLAVQGGLAVLSGAGTDPNPYVLLLACFVAAVFSERVWQKAYEYLRVQLNAEGELRSGKVEIIEAKPLALPPESKS